MDGNRLGVMKGHLVVLSFLFLSHPAFAQPGFISIDCGSSGNYTDPATNITWVPDAGFISTGYDVDSLDISAVQEEENREQMKSVRSFNDSRTRNCYAIPVQPSAIYLVRASFVYCNYDGKRAGPRFGLAIDATYWTTMDLAANPDSPGSWYRPQIAEILVPSQGTEIMFVCLIRTSPLDDPFISTLELRPITDGAYSFVNEKNVILQTVQRVNCGQLLSSDHTVRYPDDPFDRFWAGQARPADQLGGGSIITSERFPTQSITGDRPPALVLQSAWSGSGEFTFQMAGLPMNSTSFYAGLYFAAIDLSNPGDTRIMNIGFDGMLWGEPLNLTTPGDPAIVERSGELTSSSKTANFSFAKAAGSSLGPLINAYEFYAVLGSPNVATLPQDVEALFALQTQFYLESWTGDPCLPIPWDWLRCSSLFPPRVTGIHLSDAGISGAVPPAITQLGALVDLWLDNNNLTSIPFNFTPLANLQTLHLQNNKLVGNIPLSFTTLPQLRELFLEDNLFNGTFPKQLKNSSTLTVRAYGSPYLCTPGVMNCKKKRITFSTGAIIGLVLAAAVVALCILGVIIYCFCFRNFSVRNVGDRMSESSYEMYTSQESSPSLPAPSLPAEGNRLSQRKSADCLIQARNLTLDEVKLATNNFKIKIGEAQHGPVFYGQLSPDGLEVAVKQGYSHGQGQKQFLSDVALLSMFHHKNVVSLVGYCDEMEHEMLLYEFMSQGTLRDHLYGNSAKSEPLDWTTRLDVALNAARGLEYLHTQCTSGMTHGDVKSSSVLLNGGLVAEIAGLGASKFTNLDKNAPHVSNKSAGYVDPESYTGQTPTQTSDVFSFGVVLLELICGREPTRCPDQIHIVQWVKLLLQDGNIHAIVDPSLRGKYNVEAVWHIAELALLSTEAQSACRPTMSQVLRGVAEAIEIESGSAVHMPVSGDLGLISVGYNSGSSRRT